MSIGREQSGQTRSMSWGMQQSSAQRNDLLASIANDEGIQNLIREASGTGMATAAVAAANAQQNGIVYYNTAPQHNQQQQQQHQQQQQQQQQYYYYQQGGAAGYNGAVQQQYYGYQPNLPVYPVMPPQYPQQQPPAFHQSMNGRQNYRQNNPNYPMKRNSSAPSFRRQNSSQYPSAQNMNNRRGPRASHSRKQSRDNKQFNQNQQLNQQQGEEGIEMVEMERANTVPASNVSAYERYDFDSEKISQPPLQKSELDDDQNDIVIVDLSTKNNQNNNNSEKAVNEKVLKTSESEKQEKSVHFDDETENRFVDSNVKESPSQICADKLPADLEIDVTEEEENSEGVEKQLLGVEQRVVVAADADNLPDDLEIEDDVVVEQEATNQLDKQEVQVPEENVVASEEDEENNAVLETAEKEDDVVADKDVEVSTTEQQQEEMPQVQQLTEQKIFNEEEEQVKQACENGEDSVENNKLIVQKTEDVCVNEGNAPVDQKTEEIKEVEDKNQEQFQEKIQLQEKSVGDIETSAQDFQQPLEQSAFVDAFGLPDDLSAVAVEPQEKSDSAVLADEPVLPVVQSPKKEKKKKSWLPGFFRGRKNKDKNNNQNAEQQVEDQDTGVISTDSFQSSLEAPSTDSLPTHQDQELVHGPQEEQTVNEESQQNENAEEQQIMDKVEGIEVPQDITQIDEAETATISQPQGIEQVVKPKKAPPVPPPLPPKRIDRSHPGDVSSIASRFNIPDKVPLVPKILKTTSYLKNDTSVGVNLGMRRAATMARKTSLENAPFTGLAKTSSINSTVSSTHSSHDKNEEDIEPEILEENRIQKLMKGWKEGAPVKAKALGEEEDQDEVEQISEKQISQNGVRKMPPKNDNISSIRDKFKAQEQSFLQKRAEQVVSEEVSGVKGAVRKFDVPPPKPVKKEPNKNSQFGQALQSLNLKDEPAKNESQK